MGKVIGNVIVATTRVDILKMFFLPDVTKLHSYQQKKNKKTLK